MSLFHIAKEKCKVYENPFWLVESPLLATLWQILYSKQNSFIGPEAETVFVLIYLKGQYYFSMQLSRKLCLAISNTIYNREVLKS